MSSIAVHTVPLTLVGLSDDDDIIFMGMTIRTPNNNSILSEEEEAVERALGVLAVLI
jgi:hypothetical protein